MQKKRISRIRRPGRVASDVISALLVLLLLYVGLSEAFMGPVRRARRIAGRTAFAACTAAAYATARYDADTVAELMQLDTENRMVGVLTATSRLNTLSPWESVATCLRYRRLLSGLIDETSLTVSETTAVTEVNGTAQTCTLYTLSPTRAQMVDFIGTLADNMETDGGLFVLSRAFYTALMMVAQDATEVMAINAFENAWKSLSGADAAHVAETAERLLANNFPITFVAKGNRVYRFDAAFVFEESDVRLSFDSSGGLPGDRHDGVALLVDDTEMGVDNTASFAFGDGVQGELITRDGEETNVLPYGRAAG